MTYHSKYWNWAFDFCTKHAGFKLPCKWCIATDDPDLVREGPMTEDDMVVEEHVSSDKVTPPSWLKPEYYHEEQKWI